MKTMSSRVMLHILALLISAPCVWAGGIGLYEMGAPDTGSAGAGRAALAQDASTAFMNPAGMSRLDGSAVMVGMEALVITTKFEPGEGTTTTGSNGGNAGTVMPVASVFYSQKVNDKVNLGVTLGSYAGLGIEYRSDWVGRYYVQKASLITFALNPVLSYQIDSKWSVGAGFTTMLGMMDLRAAVNNGAEGDGTIQFKDQTVGFGGNAGVLFEPSAVTRLGLTYRSSVDLPFENIVSLSGLQFPLSSVQERLAGSELDTKITIPQEFMLSGYQQLTEKVALLANVGWQEWSAFGQVDVTVSRNDQREATTDIDWQDTWHGALGTQIRLAEKVVGSLGIAYDTSAVKDESRTPAMPIDDTWRYGTGVQWFVAPNATLGATYEFIDGGKAPINQTRELAGTLQGDYGSNFINVVSINLNVKF